MTPLASQWTTLQKNRGSYARPIVDGVFLYVEDIAFQFFIGLVLHLEVYPKFVAFSPDIVSKAVLPHIVDTAKSPHLPNANVIAYPPNSIVQLPFKSW